MRDHPSNGHDGRWTSRSALHMLGAMGDFWSSDLNRAAVDLINPQPGMTLLDVGAGLGPATIEAAHRIAPDGRMVAIDPSRIMRGVLRLRRLWHPSRRLIDVRPGTAEALPMGQSSVDAAFAVNAAHHFNSIEHAASELARVLKPSGRLLLIEQDFGHGDAPEPVDASLMVELLAAAGLAATHTDHHPIAGVTATVISATAPAGEPASDPGQDHPPGGGPS
jgi:ubiquinone/menaquinone biosynthesis C-methylase UbiE